MKIKSEYNFMLPECLDTVKSKKTYGTMRLAKVKDIIEIFHDMRVKKNPSYFYVILLSRVIKKLGESSIINSRVIENLTPLNFAFLVDFFNEINHNLATSFPILCENCNKIFKLELEIVGEF